MSSLRAAIQQANADPAADQILLPAGHYALTLNGPGEDLSAAGDLDLLTSMVLFGAGPTSTVISAGGLDRVLDLHAASAPISVVRTD